MMSVQWRALGQGWGAVVMLQVKVTGWALVVRTV
jgi:hypothetical protein